MSNENNSKTPNVPHLPIGPIKARPIDIVLGMTEKEDKEQLGVQFQVTQEGEHLGKMISKYFFFTDATANSKGTIDTTLKAMRAMGWQGVDVTDHKGMDKEVMLVIEHEKETDRDNKPTGGVRATVRWCNAIGVAMNKPLAGNKLSAFKQRIAAVASRQAAANGASTSKLPPIDDRPPPSDDRDAPPWMRG
jgi:hypothetical protein